MRKKSRPFHATACCAVLGRVEMKEPNRSDGHVDPLGVGQRFTFPFRLFDRYTECAESAGDRPTSDPPRVRERVGDRSTHRPEWATRVATW